MTIMTSNRLLILLACCFVQAIPFATVLTFGTLFIPMLERFEKDRATTAVVQALLMGMTMSTGVIWGIVCRKIGLPKLMFIGAVLVPLGYIASFFANSLQQLMFTIGIVSGIGTSIMYVCSSTAIARTFEGKECIIAMIIYNSASGVGTLGYPFLLDFLVNKYEISGVYLVVGGLNLNNLVVALLVCYSNMIITDVGNINTEESYLDSSTDKTQPDKSISRLLSLIKYIKSAVCQVINVRSAVVIAATGISVGCLDGFLVIVLDFVVVSKGFSVKEGLNSYTVFNACVILGTMLPAMLKFKKGMNPITIFVICPFCGCIGEILTLVASDLWLIHVGRGLSGIALGGLISGSSVALLFSVGKERFNEALGMLITSIGVVSCASGPLYGLMRDELQTYDAVIALTASLLGVSGLFSLAAMCFTKPSKDETDVKDKVSLEPLLKGRK